MNFVYRGILKRKPTMYKNHTLYITSFTIDDFALLLLLPALLEFLGLLLRFLHRNTSFALFVFVRLTDRHAVSTHIASQLSRFGVRHFIPSRVMFWNLSDGPREAVEVATMSAFCARPKSLHAPLYEEERVAINSPRTTESSERQTLKAFNCATQVLHRLEIERTMIASKDHNPTHRSLVFI